DSREAVIWMAVHHKQKKALEIFSREVAPAGTGMAPGLTGIVGGRPRVSPVLKPFFFLHPKSQIKVDIHVAGQLVQSLTEPDAPEQKQEEAPPTCDQDVPDAVQALALWSGVSVTLFCSALSRTSDPAVLSENSALRCCIYLQNQTHKTGSAASTTSGSFTQTTVMFSKQLWFYACFHLYRCMTQK
ncbi:hypothetical protein ILYODFUR_022586, partial [Ilyodon furcidens]